MSDVIVMNAVFGSFTTGNMIVDMALRTMILTLISTILTKMTSYMNVDAWYKKLQAYFCKKKYPEIMMEAESVDVYANGKKTNSKMNYSKAFLALLHYINTRPELQIKAFKETSAFHEMRDQDSSSLMRSQLEEHEKMSKLNDKYYIPNIDSEFMLDSTYEIMCHIDMNIKRCVESVGGSGNSKEDDKQIHQICLTIRKGNIYQLRKFINSAIMEHQKHQEVQLGDKQYCFQFRQCVNIDERMEVQWDEIPFHTNKTFENIFFEKKNELMSQIDFFMKNHDWYKKHGMPHHLGILLYGTPGCGKTSCIKVIAQRTGYSLIVINLNRIKSSRELETIFFSTKINNKTIPSDKRIYVFEDIDCLSSVVHDRSGINSATSSLYGDEDPENSIAKLASALVDAKKRNHMSLEEDKLNLSCILNLLDGIVETPGRIVIMTSNYPERIDAALKRPGRMDIHIELKRATRNIIVEMLSGFYEIPRERILSEYAIELGRIREDHFSIAQVSNFCVMNKYHLRNALHAMCQ